MDSPPKYQRYRELGGIINENDYKSVLARAKNTTTLDVCLIKQSEIIARVAGIELYNTATRELSEQSSNPTEQWPYGRRRMTEDGLDQRTILYGILRADIRPEKVRHHHSQMCDQQLFAEALRMLEDIDALNKLIRAHPHISFDYGQGGNG